MMQKFRFYSYGKINSTNSRAKELAEKGKLNSIVVATSQTGGRGRFNRKWHSGIGGLYMTLILGEKPERIKYLTLIAALSVRKSILGIKAELKWPNDVLVGKKKLCGILTETYSGKRNFALVGIGLNVNQKKLHVSGRNRATSLFIETGKKHDIGKLCVSIAENFSEYLGKNNGEITEEWKKHSSTIGKKIKVRLSSGKTHSGKAIGIDPECNLILQTENGEKMKIVEGDISFL